MKHENEIIKICAIIGIPLAKVMERRRKTEQVDARFLIYKWYRENARMTFMEIGKTFNRDHTTIMYGVSKADALIKYDEHFKVIWNAVSKVILPSKDVPAITSLTYKSKATIQPQ